MKLFSEMEGIQLEDFDKILRNLTMIVIPLYVGEIVVIRMQTTTIFSGTARLLKTIGEIFIMP